MEREKYASASIDEKQDNTVAENRQPETETAPSAVAAETETPAEETKPTDDTVDLAAGELEGNNKGVTKSATKAKTVSGKTEPNSQSKNPFSTPSENASHIPANTQPSAFANPLTPVPDKPIPGETTSADTFHTVQDGQTFFSIS
ncbi:hypothetical protein [Dyadobacter diqingensis]|uniref:hypothetical protein n=1 Tax=Dyadobacter diqingensis TaxID=2938121 RepID=UPI0020C3B4A5|nr:hypothetical protein [Dyadobacter diqingensis]